MKKYENYIRNLTILEDANRQDLNNQFIVGGIIDMFFIQFELGWKVLKELLLYEGISAALSGSPREIIKAAYGYFSFIDEALWLSMLAQRNSMVHVYDSQAAKDLAVKIINDYIPSFQSLNENLIDKYTNEFLNSDIIP